MCLLPCEPREWGSAGRTLNLGSYTALGSGAASSPHLPRRSSPARLPSTTHHTTMSEYEIFERDEAGTITTYVASGESRVDIIVSLSRRCDSRDGARQHHHLHGSRRKLLNQDRGPKERKATHSKHWTCSFQLASPTVCQMTTSSTTLLLLFDIHAKASRKISDICTGLTLLK